MSKPETIMIDDVKYVREDSVKKAVPGCDVNGLKYAVVRSKDQGVMAGFVKDIDGRAVTLINARHIWKYSSSFVLTDMAELGVKDASACKFSVESSQPTVMLEACGVMYCTEKGMNSIREVKAESC